MGTQAKNKTKVNNPKDWKKLDYSDSTTANDDTDAQYEELLVNARSMLHLASRSLLSSPSLNVDYDLHYSPRFRTEERAEFEDRPVLGSRHIETMGDYWLQRRDPTDGTLDRLADVESFRIASEEEITNMVGGLALTSFYHGVHPRGVKVRDDADMSKSIGSTLWIHHKLVAEFRRLRSEKGVDKALKICSLTFKGATMLCHESFHANYLATDPPLLADALVETSLHTYAAVRKTGLQNDVASNNEPLYGDNTDAELVHIWGKYVLGGHTQFDGEVDSCLFFSKWPSYWPSPKYHSRGAWHGKVTKYVVLRHYILNLLRYGFWDDMIAGDLTAFQIKKRIGIRMNCPYLRHVGPMWVTEDSSKGHWSARLCQESAER